MKRFGLGLTMVILSMLPALLMFAHATGGSYDKEKVYPRAGRVYSPAGKNSKLATKTGPSASRAPNPPKPAQKPPNPNAVRCKNCSSLPHGPLGVEPPHDVTHKSTRKRT